jgi:hypothetical protein
MIEDEEGLYEEYDGDYYDDEDDEDPDPALADIDWDKIDGIRSQFEEKEVYVTNLDFPFHNSDHTIDGYNFSGWYLMQCTGHKFFDQQAVYVVKFIAHVSDAFPYENEITVAELLEAWGCDVCAYINSLDGKCRICIPLSCIALKTDREDGLAPRKAAQVAKRRW